MHIAIIGGGVAGLGVAYFLARSGYAVEVFEQAAELGGLAGTFDFDGFRVEKYYHFICRDDQPLLAMLADLGLAEEVDWKPGRMRFAFGPRLYPFETPWDLLRFEPLSFIDRLRFGAVVAWYRRRNNWRAYERHTAREWLLARFGRAAFETIWAPLLELKFGRFASEVSAAWIWHRIHRLARSRDGLLGQEKLGFLRGGTDVLLSRLIAQLRERGVVLHTRARVERILVEHGQVCGIRVEGEDRHYAAVVSTVPLPVLARILAEAPAEFLQYAQSIDYLAVLCVLLRLRRPLSDGFWINVHADGVPFTGLIEYTNLNPRTDAASPYLLYVPYYLAADDERFQWEDARIVDDTMRGLQLLFPSFAPSLIAGVRVFRDRYAQAVCRRNFSRSVPDLRGPYPRLYLTDSTQLYPADRTISGMFGLAQDLARLVESDLPLHRGRLDSSGTPTKMP